MTEALRKVSRSCVRSYVWRTAWTASLGFFSLAALAGENPVRYLRFDEVRETLLLHADSGLPGSEIKGSEAWDAWIRARDAEVRGRIEGGIEDSISNLILYGTSFTSLPRVESVEFAATETGELRPATVARIHALALALASGAKDERVRFVRDFLARKGIGKNSEESYFTENLRRFIAEQAAYQQKLQDAAKKEGEPSAVYLARGTLFETRGLSVDTSLLPNFALEETLGAMIRKSALTAGSMRRIAVIGPGLDFTKLTPSSFRATLERSGARRRSLIGRTLARFSDRPRGLCLSPLLWVTSRFAPWPSVRNSHRTYRSTMRTSWRKPWTSRPDKASTSWSLPTCSSITTDWSKLSPWPISPGC